MPDPINNSSLVMRLAVESVNSRTSSTSAVKTIVVPKLFPSEKGCKVSTVVTPDKVTVLYDANASSDAISIEILKEPAIVHVRSPVVKSHPSPASYCVVATANKRLISNVLIVVVDVLQYI